MPAPRVAILSAGPRLAETFDPHEPYHARVAVNSAAALFSCQFWSCGDAQTFARVVPPTEWPVPVLFTLTDSDAHFRYRSQTAKRLEAHRLVMWSQVQQRTHAPQEAAQWSVTAALMLAVDLGAREVDVFGHYHEGEDPANVTDCLGHELAKRLDTRPRVMADWAVVRRWAQSLGVKVHERVPIESGVASCT